MAINQKSVPPFQRGSETYNTFIPVILIFYVEELVIPSAEALLEQLWAFFPMRQFPDRHFVTCTPSVGVKEDSACGLNDECVVLVEMCTNELDVCCLPSLQVARAVQVLVIIAKASTD